MFGLVWVVLRDAASLGIELPRVVISFDTAAESGRALGAVSVLADDVPAGAHVTELSEHCRSVFVGLLACQGGEDCTVLFVGTHLSVANA